MSERTWTAPPQTTALPGQGPDARPNGGGKADADRFKRVFRHHPAGVAVVTFRTRAGPAGFTATSVISVSADPPVLAFSVASGTSAHALVRTVPRVAVNLLAEDQAELARRFAAHGADRFAGCPWRELPTGEPVLSGTVSWLSGSLLGLVEAGSSLIATVEVHEAHRNRPARPLVYADRTFRTLGGEARTH
ncbi:flavin reductase family protein [Nocardiopsis sp. RSe5-2]|uniref:Flavin reductase family protein n=1 Tax=Nocardiopsis endophytica TaxID=3018445 RepID=A0ABT4U1X3_9ACTN|nr:flavin reductase family protein [Nocardiopsis endophytica]MDA2810922.1 flavin reductase family protein [Nocardiopsis endophytica]